MAEGLALKVAEMIYLEDNITRMVEHRCKMLLIYRRCVCTSQIFVPTLKTNNVTSTTVRLVLGQSKKWTSSFIYIFDHPLIICL